MAEEVGPSPRFLFSPLLRVALTLGAMLWCLGLMLFPLTLQGGVWQEGGFLSRTFFAMTCHQDPSRSFHLFGHPLSVCARCTGVYGGFTLVLIAWPALPRMRRMASRTGILLAAVSVTALDWALSALFSLPSSNLTRALSGAVGGAALALLLARELDPSISRIFPSHQPE